MWVKLEGFQLDDKNAVLDFSTRLAGENGWSRAYTAFVIQEYKRFLLLAVHAGHPVTPPDAVDQAWHLHLVYTRSYWGALCRDTLGRPLHHGPTEGGEREAGKFADWYDKTLESYRRIFDCAPPAVVWPESAARFDRRAKYQRVNVSRYWLLRKMQLRRPAMAAATAATGLGLAACTTGSFLGGDTWLIVMLATLLLGIVIAAIRSRNNRDTRSGGSERGGTGGCGYGSGISGCGGGDKDEGSGHSGSESHGGHSGCSSSDGGSSGCGGGCGGGD